MLSPFELMLVVGRENIGELEILKVIEQAAENGVTSIQLREKKTPDAEFVKHAISVKNLLKGSSVPLILNDRVEVALAVQADGVHLGQTDGSCLEARKRLGKTSVIGLTVETLYQAQAANEFEIDYLGLSTVFSSTTKPEALPYWDENKIRELKSFSKHRLIGIGGITLQNAYFVLSIGVDGIAVTSAICLSRTLEEVAEKTRRLRTVVESFYAKKV